MATAVIFTVGLSEWSNQHFPSLPLLCDWKLALLFVLAPYARWHILSVLMDGV